MPKVLAGIVILLFLAGCGSSKNLIQIQESDFTRDFVAPVTLQASLTPAEKEQVAVLYYYQGEEKKDQATDRLSISKDFNPWEKNLSQYAQKIHNELLGAGYSIKNISNTSNKLNNSKGEKIKTLLRNYLIQDNNGERRYMSDYYFILDKKVSRISYSSAKESNRKKFISAIKKIQF